MKERNFKGIWIPKEIWESDELTLREKVFLVEIDSLDGDDGCYASNDHFAKFFGLSKNRCSEVINSLNHKGYITIRYLYKDKTKQIEKRIIKIVKTKYFGIRKTDRGIRKTDRGIRKTEGGYSEKCEDNNTLINNTINNTTTTTTSDCSCSDFNIFKYAELRNFILSPIQVQQLQEDINIYSLEEVKKALDIADDNGKHTYSYVKGILQKRRSGSDKKRSSEEEFEKIRQKALETGEEPF